MGLNAGEVSRSSRHSGCPAGTLFFFHTDYRRGGRSCNTGVVRMGALDPAKALARNPDTGYVAALNLHCDLERAEHAIHCCGRLEELLESSGHIFRQICRF